ncbi:MAG: hypothetical protein QM723_02820 [Myxococcaceae bacterium]
MRPICPRCGLDDFREGVVEVMCPRCHTHFNVQRPPATPLPSIEEALAQLDAPDAATRVRMRWVLRELGDAAVHALADEHARNPRETTRGALCFLGTRAAPVAARFPEDSELVAALAGPWPLDPKKPVPYLGESVLLDSDAEPDRAWFGKPAWDEMVDAARYLAEADDEEPDSCEKWQPDRVVIGRSELTLFLHSWELNRGVDVVVTTPDGAPFTMAELLYATVRAVHDNAGDFGTRIFEGLRLMSPGRYEVRTGS